MSVSSFYSDDWHSLPTEQTMEMLNVDDLSSENFAAANAIESFLPLLCEPESLEQLIGGSDDLRYPSGDAAMRSGERVAILPKLVRDKLSVGSFTYEADDIFVPGTHYALISDMKAQADQTNLVATDPWYMRHQFRARQFFSGVSGLVLDIGCGDTKVSRKVFPSDITYLGIDPSPHSSDEFSLCGFAETLPIKSQSVDTVVFNTSLDHVLDEHTAVDEAYRVLKPGGQIYVSVLIWHKDATLLYDNAHFHHFRDWEIRGLFSAFTIDKFMKVNWKNSANRYGVYFGGHKPL